MLVAAILFGIATVLAQPLVFDLDGRPVEPPGGGARATVVVFLRTDCPISNRYAPELRRLHDRFAGEQVAFWLVFPERATSAAALRAYLAGFGLRGRPVRDPQQALAERFGATVTPEAVVLDARGAVAYRGAIDDRWAGFGLERPQAARRFLEDAIDATLAGRPATPRATRAVGCFLADLR